MKKQYFYILSLILLIGCLKKNPKNYFAESEKFGKQRQYKEAISELDKALVNDDKFPAAYFNRGAYKSLLGDYVGAVADYKRVLELDAENTLAYFSIGKNIKKLGNNRLAIDYYTKALHTLSRETLYVNTTTNNTEGKCTDDALEPEISFERGIAFFEIDSLQKALSDFQSCISKKYLVAESNYRIGCIFYKVGNKERGCALYKKAVELGFKEAKVIIKMYCEKH